MGSTRDFGASVAALMLVTGWTVPAAAQTILPPTYDAITTDAVVFANCFAGDQADPFLLSVETLSCPGNVAGQQQTAIARYPNEGGPIVSDAAFGPDAVSPNEVYGGTAHASADPHWKLGASATDTYTCATGGSGVGCSQSHATWGVATLSETFEVYAPSPPKIGSPAPGSNGSMRFTFEITGSATGLAGAIVGLGMSGGCFSLVGCGRIDDYLGNGYTLWYELGSVPISPTGKTFFTFPDPIPFSFSDNASILPTVVTVALGAEAIARGYDTSSSSASFADTMTLSEIDVQDGNGTAVSGYRILTGSGTDLSQIAVGSVPEPGTMSALLSAVACMVGIHATRRRRLST